jgi:uncharacterized membrane protein YhaH (DUF805 family)
MGSLAFQVAVLLGGRSDLLPAIRAFGTFAHLASGVLLLSFVIVAGGGSPAAATDRPGGIFSMRGRYNRARYFWTSLILSVVFNIPRLLVRLAAESLGDGYAIAMFIALAFAFAGAVLVAFQVVKRLHDLGRPGWHYWLLLIPIYDIYLALVLLFCKGTAGPNPYGVDPLARDGEGAQLEPKTGGS